MGSVADGAVFLVDGQRLRDIVGMSLAGGFDQGEGSEMDVSVRACLRLHCSHTRPAQDIDMQDTPRRLPLAPFLPL